MIMAGPLRHMEPRMTDADARRIARAAWVQHCKERGVDPDERPPTPRSGATSSSSGRSGASGTYRAVSSSGLDPWDAPYGVRGGYAAASDDGSCD